MVDDSQNSNDSASSFDDLANIAESPEQPTVAAQPAPQPPKASPPPAPTGPKAKAPKDEVKLLRKEIMDVSDYIKDLETLVIAKVVNKIHISYYRSWTADLRQAYGLISRLNRRANEVQAKRDGKLSHDLQTG